MFQYRCVSVVSRLSSCSLGGAMAPAHVGKKPIYVALLARLVANLPRFGGRAVDIGLKLTTGVEEKLSTRFNLGPPAVEVRGSASTVCGMGRPGRISRGLFLHRPPTCQVSAAGADGGGSSLNAAGGGGCPV